MVEQGFKGGKELYPPNVWGEDDPIWQLRIFFGEKFGGKNHHQFYTP